MTNSFNMSNWRRKHILMAENDSDPKAIQEYDETIHGKITSFEDVLFEPQEAPTNVIFSVATEKDLENAKDITIPFQKFAKWANEEGYDLEDEDASRDAGKQYFEEYYSKYLTDEGIKSLKAQMFETEGPSQEENPVDIISMDVPLFIRMLEFAREDASTDMDLHDLAEKAVKMSAQGQPMSMMHYDELTAKEVPAVDAMSLYEKYFNAE